MKKRSCCDGTSLTSAVRLWAAGIPRGPGAGAAYTALRAGARCITGSKAAAAKAAHLGPYIRCIHEKEFLHAVG